MIESAVLWLLKFLAVPTVGLTSVFLIAFVSATLLPLGSEPAVFAVVKANPAMFWPAVLVATLGNTLGGIVDYWIGYLESGGDPAKVLFFFTQLPEYVGLSLPNIENGYWVT